LKLAYWENLYTNPPYFLTCATLPKNKNMPVVIEVPDHMAARRYFSGKMLFKPNIQETELYRLQTKKTRQHAEYIHTITFNQIRNKYFE